MTGNGFEEAVEDLTSSSAKSVGTALVFWLSTRDARACLSAYSIPDGGEEETNMARTKQGMSVGKLLLFLFMGIFALSCAMVGWILWLIRSMPAWPEWRGLDREP